MSRGGRDLVFRSRWRVCWLCTSHRMHLVPRLNSSPRPSWSVLVLLTYLLYSSISECRTDRRRVLLGRCWCRLLGRGFCWIRFLGCHRRRQLKVGYAVQYPSRSLACFCRNLEWRCMHRGAGRRSRSRCCRLWFHGIEARIAFLACRLDYFLLQRAGFIPSFPIVIASDTPMVLYCQPRNPSFCTDSLMALPRSSTKCLSMKVGVISHEVVHLQCML